MKKIGEGWDYTVYAVADGSRVRKIRKTKPQLLWLLFKTFNVVSFFKVLFSHSFNEHIASSCTFVQELLTEKPQLAWFFSNVTFGEYCSYDQDKVIPLRTYMRTASLQKKKEILEIYIQAIHFMWNHGFSDTSFKFSKNYGIDRQGRIVLIDISNLTENKEQVRKMLHSKLPLKVWVYKKMFPISLKKYYKSLVEIFLTPEKLDALWH